MFHPVAEETAVTKSPQAVVVGSDPKRSFRIFIDAPDMIGRSTSRHGVGNEFALIEARQISGSSDPERTLMIFMNHSYIVGGQSFLRGVVSGNATVAKSKQTT